MDQKEYPFGKKLIQDLLLLGANDEYKADMGKLSKKYDFSFNDGDVLDGEKELNFLKNTKLLELMGEYLKIIEKYGLVNLFSLHLQHLLVNGTVTKIVQGEKVKLDSKEFVRNIISSSGVKIVEEKEEYVTLDIYKNTTIKDLQKIWPDIKKRLNGEAGRKKESKNIKRDMRILSLKNKGLKAKEIASIINSDKEYSQHKITYQEVSRIIQRLKVKSKKNIPHKDS